MLILKRFSNSAGFSIVELMVAASVATLLVLGTMTSLNQYLEVKNRVDSSVAIRTLKDEISDEMNSKPTCMAAFLLADGVTRQTITAAAPTNVSLNLFAGGIAHGPALRIAPAAGQNMLGSNWQITQVRVVPISAAVPSFNIGNFYLAAELVFTAQRLPVGANALTEQANAKINFELTGAGNIVGCATSRRQAGPVPLPICKSDERLTLKTWLVGADPQWACIHISGWAPCAPLGALCGAGSDCCSGSCLAGPNGTNTCQ